MKSLVGYMIGCPIGAVLGAYTFAYWTGRPMDWLNVVTSAMIVFLFLAAFDKIKGEF